METCLVFFVIVLVLLALGAAGAEKARSRRAADHARHMQDMLTRGLSVEEIERLMKLSPNTTRPERPAGSTPRKRPSEVALSLAAAVESMVRAERDTGEIAGFLDAFLGRIDARVKQDMLARGLSVEEIERLMSPSPGSLSPERSQKAALGLAAALESMAAEETDTEEIAAFLDTFLGRSAEQEEIGKVPNPTQEPTEAAIKVPRSSTALQVAPAAEVSRSPHS
jgi:hypothetical protein